MDPTLTGCVISLALFVAMLLLLELGRRIGIRRMSVDAEGAHVGVGAVNGAVFSLLGLLLAFAYANASGRFDERRRLVVEETNDIGTAWLRLDMLAEADQPALRDAFRRYVDSRIAIYRAATEENDLSAYLERSSRVQSELWDLGAAACSRPEGERARLLLLPALNAMIDITTTRLSMTHMHLPAIVFGMLIVLALASALLAGISMAPGKRRKHLHLILFAALISAMLYLIIDIEYPRRGLVRIDDFDQMLVDLRRSMD